MRVEEITLESFRNYERQSVKFDPGINVIAGKNAQGKTNLLESVFFLSCGHSFRTRNDKELISFGESFARVSGNIFSQERERELVISFGAGLKKKAESGGARIALSELSEALRVVLFSPEDLNIIKDGAARRRRFLDIALGQLRPNYARILAEYSRLYDHKKRILTEWREKRSMLDMLDEFSDSLSRASAQLIRYRAAYIRKLRESAKPLYSELSGGEQLELSYKTVSTVTDPFATAREIYEQVSEHERLHREAELQSGSVLSGIHKDELEIFINDSPARAYASQGQTRSAALALKMAEREVSRLDTGETPVLLLDDVLSELDSSRQEFVLNRIGGGQTLITCCEDEEIRRRTGGRVFTVEGGRLV
ncbi:MAG: DNA replication/repair protein RecF [Oscillospiraceae bacterium]|jgi:DNA replication and repair protein RecF|nr:DNA replication/repair protein RecF [Oscillospiraceae bacterium]